MQENEKTNAVDRIVANQRAPLKEHQVDKKEVTDLMSADELPPIYNRQDGSKRRKIYLASPLVS